MGWGSSTRRGGGQKVRYAPRNQGNQTLLAGHPRILPEKFPEFCPRSLRKKSSCSIFVGRTPKGAYSTRGRSRHLLETAFSEPLLKTLLRTHFYCKTHSRPPSQNPSENPSPEPFPRTFSEPLLERCVAIRPLRRAPKIWPLLKRGCANSVVGLGLAEWL